MVTFIAVSFEIVNGYMKWIVLCTICLYFHNISNFNFILETVYSDDARLVAFSSLYI